MLRYLILLTSAAIGSAVGVTVGAVVCAVSSIASGLYNKNLCVSTVAMSSISGAITGLTVGSQIGMVVV
jgi:hypothetical protein